MTYLCSNLMFALIIIYSEHLYLKHVNECLVGRFFLSGQMISALTLARGDFGGGGGGHGLGQEIKVPIFVS